MPGYTASFSHMGIWVKSLEPMIAFYSGILGFPVSDRGMLHGTIPIAFLSRDPREHHQLALIQGRPGDKEDSVVHQISFRIPDLDQLKELRRVLLERDFTNQRSVTHGNAWAIYVKDPEDNQVELFVDSDWYIEQPCSLPLDLDQPSEDIRRATLEFCRTQPGFKPVADWRDEMSKRIGGHVFG